MFAYSALHVDLGSRKVNTIQHASTEPFLVTHIFLSTPVPQELLLPYPSLYPYPIIHMTEFGSQRH